MSASKNSIATLLMNIISLTAINAPIVAEDGMYPMSELPRLNLAEKGIELTADQLFNPDQISLVDGICRVNGCTGSFVSDNGLIITNHHCAFDAIQKASTPQLDLLADGFSAETREQEISAPDYQVRITENYRDVSAEVLSSIADNMPFLERTKAIDKRRKELEVAAEMESPGLRAEVAEMFAGKTYVLFLYTYLKDVRLVFAPPASIGNFGGEVDNWEWPRHTGDFSFLRAYTAPDGSSATYAQQNVPYKPKRFIQVAPEGVDENDAVFLMGYPGRTARHKTASFLRYEQDVRLPMIVDLFNWQIDVMEQAGTKDRIVEIKHASRMRSLANVEKRSRGQLLGLRRAKIVSGRDQQETELQKFIDSDAARSAKYGSLLKDIAAVYAEMSEAAAFEINLVQLRQACRAAAFGYFVYDAAVERQKLDLDRETPYMDRNFPQSVQELRVSMSDWHLPTDQILLTGMLERLSKLPAARQIEPLKLLLAYSETLPATADTDSDLRTGRTTGVTPGTFAAAAETLLANTRLGDANFVQECLKKTPVELQQVDDPLLQLIIQLHPAYLNLRDIEKTRDGRLSQLYGSLIEVKQQFLATNFIPDANSTLRFTCGRIRSYSPADAVIRTPISTLRGVIEKTTGVEPFITPERVLQKYENREFGHFVHPRLGEVPVAILYDTDTTGGNSGSPVLNTKGQLVGVNFDRCFEATINDFAWNRDYSRSIGVDIRYVLWITGIVYDANHLLREMGIQ